MAGPFQIGDGLRLTGTFTDAVSSAAVDPSTVKFSIRSPTGGTTVSTYPSNITRSSTGIYYSDYTVLEGGTHYYRWAGSVSYPSATEDSFEVAYSLV